MSPIAIVRPATSRTSERNGVHEALLPGPARRMLPRRWDRRPAGLWTPDRRDAGPTGRNIPPAGPGSPSHSPLAPAARASQSSPEPPPRLARGRPHAVRAQQLGDAGVPGQYRVGHRERPPGDRPPDHLVPGEGPPARVAIGGRPPGGVDDHERRDRKSV